MNWVEQYRQKIVSAQEAVRAIQSNQRVFLSGNSSIPNTLLVALVELAPELQNVEIIHALIFGAAVDYVSPQLEGHLRVNTIFISDATRKAVQEGRADFTP
ncbi:MAG: hypothetical protein MUO64_10295, partial [Anaerolineales bacterium]|nr:hypothetical protein [Anaerolineales bacterium]